MYACVPQILGTLYCAQPVPFGAVYFLLNEQNKNHSFHLPSGQRAPRVSFVTYVWAAI